MNRKHPLNGDTSGKYVKARQYHTCFICNDLIHPGEEYWQEMEYDITCKDWFPTFNKAHDGCQARSKSNG